VPLVADDVAVVDVAVVDAALVDEEVVVAVVPS
jgi:hypothetical protein